MNRACLMLLLTVVSNSATANWIKVVTSDDISVNVYIGRATIIEADNNVKMWFLLDHRETQNLDGIPYLSEVEQLEFDCKKEQLRKLYYALHSKNRGGGDSVYKNTDSGKWQPSMLGSENEIIWKAACSRIK